MPKPKFFQPKQVLPLIAAILLFFSPFSAWLHDYVVYGIPLKGYYYILEIDSCYPIMPSSHGFFLSLILFTVGFALVFIHMEQMEKKN